MHPYDDDVKRMSPTQLAAATAVGASLLALVLKLALAQAGGMVSVWAAGFHALAGLLYAALILGILYSPDEQPVDPDVSEAEREYLQYQSGLKLNLKRTEAIWALVGSAGLLAVAYFVFTRVLAAAPTEPRRLTLTLAGLAVVFFGMQFLGRFTYRVGMAQAAPGLVASSFHARTDAFATLLAGVAVIVAAMGYPFERYLAALIGLLLVADAAQLFVDATRRIVGLEEDSPTAQLPFWVRLRDALQAYAEAMPPIVRWLLRYEDAMTPQEVRRARWWAGGTVLVLYLASGFKQVPVGEVGAVKLLGQPAAFAHSGPVYALWPFATLRKVPVDRVQSVTIGFEHKGTWAPHQENREFGEMLWVNQEQENKLFTIDNEQSKFMLGDRTQVETHVVLNFSVDPEPATISRYLFAVEAPRELVNRAAQHALQTAFGTRKLDEVLVGSQAGLERRIARMVQATLDPYHLGIRVESCLIRSLHPPVEVLDAFADASAAQQDKAREIHRAQTDAGRMHELASGEAARVTNNAEAFHAQRLSEARGSVSQFNQVLGAARQAPDAVRSRLEIETYERTLSGKPKVILPRSAGGRSPTLYFNGTSGPTGLPMGAMGGPPPGPAGQPAPGEAPADGTTDAATGEPTNPAEGG